MIEKQFLAFKFQIGEFFDLLYLTANPTMVTRRLMEKMKKIYFMLMNLQDVIKDLKEENYFDGNDFELGRQSLCLSSA